MKQGWNIRLKNKRQEAKLSLNEVGRQSERKLTQQSLITYENGDVIPRADVLADLCRIYKCSVDYIIYGSENVGIVVDEGDALVSIWYLLATKQIALDENNLQILDKRLQRNAFYLDTFVKQSGLSSVKDLYGLIDGIKRMKEDGE